MAIVINGSTGISATNDTELLADGSVTAAKLAAGAAVSNIGYTPVNKAGDTLTGNLNVDGTVVASGDVTAYGTV